MSEKPVVNVNYSTGLGCATIILALAIAFGSCSLVDKVFDRLEQLEKVKTKAGEAQP